MKTFGMKTTPMSSSEPARCALTILVAAAGCQGSVAVSSPPPPDTPIAAIHSRGDFKTPNTRRFYWVAKDPISHDAVLLHTDAYLSTDYTVASSWSPRVPRSSDVPRKEWTECFVGQLKPPKDDSSLEAIRLEARADNIVMLDLSWDLGFPESPYTYQCTASGPIRIGY